MDQDQKIKGQTAPFEAFENDSPFSLSGKFSRFFNREIKLWLHRGWRATQACYGTHVSLLSDLCFEESRASLSLIPKVTS